MENKAVILNKFETIEKCINRINEEYQNESENLKDYRKVDMIVLNLQRACEAVMDLAMYSKNYFKFRKLIGEKI